MKYVLLALALAACDPHLYQQSVAPPGRSARLDEVTGFWGNIKYYKLEVSEGVALAVTCNNGAPCSKMTIASDNPQIAEVRPASLSALEQVSFANQIPSSAFVIIGKAPGATKLHLKAKEGTRDVVVTVVAPPPTPNAQTAAK